MIRILILLIAFLPGCSLRSVTYPDGITQTDLILGPVASLDCTTSTNVSERMVRMGLWAENGEAGLGFKSTKRFCGSGECAVVIWPASDIQRDEMIALTEHLDGICIV